MPNVSIRRYACYHEQKTAKSNLTYHTLHNIMYDYALTSLFTEKNKKFYFNSMSILLLYIYDILVLNYNLCYYLVIVR